MKQLTETAQILVGLLIKLKFFFSNFTVMDLGAKEGPVLFLHVVCCLGIKTPFIHIGKNPFLVTQNFNTLNSYFILFFLFYHSHLKSKILNQTA